MIIVNTSNVILRKVDSRRKGKKMKLIVFSSYDVPKSRYVTTY